MDPEINDKCIAHVRHCMAYKKIIMRKVIEPINLPDVIGKAVFTYVGFFPIVLAGYLKVRPVRLKE